MVERRRARHVAEATWSVGQQQFADAVHVVHAGAAAVEAFALAGGKGHAHELARLHTR